MKERYQVTLTKEYVDAYKIDAITNGPHLSLSFFLDEHLRELYGDGIEPTQSKAKVTPPPGGIKDFAVSLGMTTGNKMETKTFLPPPPVYAKRQEVGPDEYPVIEEEHYE